MMDTDDLIQALAINPQDPIATELLEKALEENASRDGMFTTQTLSPDGQVVTTDSDDVDAIIRQRQWQLGKRAEESHGKNWARGEHSRAAGRKRLGDVRGFGGMEMSDDEGLL